MHSCQADKKPLLEVSAEIYMKIQKKDSLKEKVFTDSDL